MENKKELDNIKFEFQKELEKELKKNDTKYKPRIVHYININGISPQDAREKIMEYEYKYDRVDSINYFIPTTFDKIEILDEHLYFIVVYIPIGGLSPQKVIYHCNKIIKLNDTDKNERIYYYYIPTKDDVYDTQIKMEMLNLQNIDNELKEETIKNLEELNNKVLNKIKELDEE